MQVNGFQGSDYSLDDLDLNHIERIVASLAESGVTGHVPTIVTRPRERIVRNLRVISQARKESSLLAATIPAIHIEGPFISHEDGPRGAHDPRYVRDPDFDEFLEWQDAAGGLVKMVTLAPERRGALEFIGKLASAGVVASIGHSAASPEQIREAVAAGASFSTHLGNGSHASLPRLRNYLWEQLADDRLSVGMIADGFHLPEAVVKVILRAKGLEKIVLVSDVSLPGGWEPGVYRWGNLDVEVHPDGHVGLKGTSFLAGAGHRLDHDIATFMKFTGVPLFDTLKLCTRTPARILGLPSSAGRLEAGASADLTLFRYDGQNPLKVETTVIAGQRIHG
jgi:N-acetylglucosamine-6-phosphate deacetylase